MESEGVNKRRYRRIYFSEDLLISGVIAESDTHTEFLVKILNLSEGGLFFTVAREKARYFQEKGTVLFLGLRGPGPFNLAEKLNMEIKWVCDNEIMENIGYGCEFIDPPSRSVDQIRCMVNDFLADSMKYGDGKIRA